MSLFLIGYDISDPRRLQKVHRIMIGHSVALEYSIFLLEGSAADLKRCLDEVIKQIAIKEDDLRCYPLPQRGLQLRFGKVAFPQGIVWTGLPARANLL